LKRTPRITIISPGARWSSPISFESDLILESSWSVTHFRVLKNRYAQLATELEWITAKEASALRYSIGDESVMLDVFPDLNDVRDEIPLL